MNDKSRPFRNCTFETTEEAPAAGRFTPQEPYFDARVRTPFNEADYQRPITISVGPRTDSKNWKSMTNPLAGFIRNLCEHKVGQKDGPAFVLGDMHNGQRLKAAVKSMSAIGLDIDLGTPAHVVKAALDKLGCLAVCYSTHSHFKTETEFKRDKIRKFNADADIDTELMRDFVRQDQHWDATIADSVEFVKEEHTDKGIVVIISHDPMPKWRVIIFLDQPFVIANEGNTQKDATDKWAKVIDSMAAKLGLPYDRACIDPSRLFYFPRHDKKRAFEVTLWGGPLFDWRTLVLENPLEAFAKDGNRGKSKSVTPAGRELGRWAIKRASGFQIVDVIEAYVPEKLRGTAAGGVLIECPFDEDHSDAGNPDDKACLAINAGMGTSPIFTVMCHHESCRDKTAIDHVGKMVKDQWFPKEVLEDEQFLAEVIDPDAGEAQEPPPTDESQTFDFYNEEALVAEIDSICRVVALGGKRRFVFLGREDEPQFLTQSDAAIELAQYKLWKNKGTEKEPYWVPQPAFNVWLGSSKRKPNFSAARFDPNLKTGDVGNGVLNLWTGFAFEPKPGDWSLLRNHIWHNICQENEECFTFLMGWMAQLFQEPGRKIGVAVVLRGDIGVGKTKLAEWIGNIIGDRHAITTDKSEQCTGKFNAALEWNIFISAEEAFFAGDPRQSGPLKHLITGHKMMYEPKGRDSYMGMNYSRLMMTTNVKWAVPAVARERRYLVLDVSPKRQKQKAYFKAIDEQMKSGGAAAMLHELLEYDYSAIDFQNPPVTDALKDIIHRGIDSSEKWLVSVLTEGAFPRRSEFGHSGTEWDKGGAEIAKAAIVASYNDFVPSYKKTPADAQDLQFFLRERIGTLTSTKLTVGKGKFKKREPSWKLPSLAEARKTYSETTGYVFEPEEEED